jgi:UDP-N-acetylmuramoylalanine--D-glutamate ligase
MEAYGAAKLRLFQNMGSEDVAILPPDTTGLPTDPIATRSIAPRLLWIGRAPGLVLTEEALHISGTPDDGPLSLEGFTLLGEHNRINAGVAAMIAICAGASRDRLDLSRLEPLEHRLEQVHLDDGVEWINDSKATNIESTLAALEGVAGRLLVLLGGKGKEGANYSLLRPILAARASAIICFGASAAEIAEALTGLPVQQQRGLSEAVSHARALARPGDTILLSPACASFDEFSNFEERGQVFTQLARGAKS